jgi:hypothetical protein
MVGETAHEEIRAGRTVGLNAIETAAAVLGLRREMSGAFQRWTLGPYGTFEMDSHFIGLTLSAQTRRGDQRIETSGRLWSPDGMAVVSVTVALESSLAPPTQVSLTVASQLPPTFALNMVGLRALAFAALEELCEEVLFHAASTRAHAKS